MSTGESSAWVAIAAMLATRIDEANSSFLQWAVHDRP
jgi:hypothetical protein